MKFPAYWSRGTAEGEGADGKRQIATCWGWSETSRADAERSALETARRALLRLIGGEPRGQYGYGTRPLREEVLQRFTNDRGELVAVVTQNTWGALVLSTVSAMFVDVDFDEAGLGEMLVHWFRRLFGRTSVHPDEQHEADARAPIEAFVRDRPGWAMRLYRTRAGLRALATHDLFDPASESTLEIFDALGADPTYVRLCKAQASFRARLTAKPWRCGHTEKYVRWPREKPEEQARHEQWQAAYVEKQAGYATCRYVGTLGDGTVHPEIAPLIEVHDRVSRATEPLELA